MITSRGYVVLIPRSNYPAGAPYVGVHLATLGVYTGVALLLRYVGRVLSISFYLL